MRRWPACVRCSRRPTRRSGVTRRCRRRTRCRCSAGLTEAAAMRLTLIEHADLYTPEPAGITSVLLAGHKLLKIGPVDARHLAALDLPVETIDATGCHVVPGLVDPHANV